MKCLSLKKVKLKRKYLGVIFVVMCAIYLIIYYNSKEFIYFSVKIGRQIVCKTFESSSFLKSDVNRTLRSPPVILETNFGLGNQLFQYAASYSIARRRNSDLYICVDSRDAHLDKSSSISMTFDPWDRSYGLGRFKIPHDKLLIKPNKGNSTCESLLSASLYLPSFIANDEAVVKCGIPVDRIVKVDGYFESEIFFHEYKEELLEIFVLDDEKTMEKETEGFLRQIKETESVCVHVRRRDFDSNSARKLPHSYYSEAMSLMDEKLAELPNVVGLNRTFFIFSDDIAKVKQDFNETIDADKFRMVFVSNENFSRYHDLFLMTKCRHSIMSNSTFSWWAAYLNRYKDKIVIAPLPKFKETYNFWNHPYGKLVKNVQYYWAYPTSYLVIQPNFA